MPDTYGSPFDQIRGFVENGWSKMGNKQGDISPQSPLLQLSLQDFEAKLSLLTENDTIIVLITAEGADNKAIISNALCIAITRAAILGAKISILASIANDDVIGLERIHQLKTIVYYAKSGIFTFDDNDECILIIIMIC